MTRRGSRSGLSRDSRIRSAVCTLLGAAIILGLSISHAATAAPESVPAPTLESDHQAEGAAGTFAVETYSCPPGMDLQTLDPAACTLSPEPVVEWRLSSDRLSEPLTQADADIVDGTVTWDGLPPGEYFVDLTAEVYFFGHDDYVIPSSNQVTRQDEHTTRIFYRSAPPRESTNAYVFSKSGLAMGPGIVASVHNCPPETVLADIQVVPCDEPVASGQIKVVCGEQGAIVHLDRNFRLDDLAVAAALPPGPCHLTVRDLPGAHDLVYVFGGSHAGTFREEETFRFDLDLTTVEADGDLHLTIYFVDASTPDDRDGDGLSNVDEDEFGTDAANADTDSDGASDFNEIRFGSDPRDATSLP